VRCPRCGNENPEDNRFCGMCGTTLLAPTPPSNAPQAVGVGSTPAARPDAAPSRTSAETPRKAPVPVPDNTASISGPSFLGLNDAPPSRVTAAKRASISIDPDRAPPASNLHYLLEDEEDHKGSGIWKFFLILIALGLAVGFGYLRWKNQGFAWLNPPKKPAITEEQPASGENQQSPPGATTGQAPSTSTATPSITPEPQPAQPPAGTTGAGANTAASPTSSTAGSSPAATAPASTDASRAPDSANTGAPPEKVPNASSTTAPPDKSAADAAKANDDADSTDDAPPAAKPKAEPAAKPRPAVPTDPVSEARKYLYGKGAAQDCDRGLRLLKPSANAGNPKAMVEMGALYSAGLCTPRDLPTAYRWFAVALRKEPDNQSVQADLQKLWSEMTQPERQLAIKLTQ